MKYKNILFLILVISLALAPSAKALKYEYTGFENTVPANWSAINGALSMSSAHYKLDNESMKWDFEANGKIEVINPMGVITALNTYKGGLMLWIYNETPINDKIRFEYSQDNTVHYWFDYNINFKGWRACWIRFDQDMEGTKGTNNINKMTITAPATAGSLFFDRYIHPDNRINDRVTGDAQLPDINPDVSYDNHWAALWHWYSTRNYDIELTTPTSDELNEVSTIRTRLTNRLAGSAPSSSALSAAMSTATSYNIVVNPDTSTTGTPYLSDDECDFDRGEIRMDMVGDVMLTLARGYYFNTNNYQARELYFKIYDHIIDQGLCIGSGMGTNHHYGYHFREMAVSFLLMYDYMCTRLKRKLLIYHPQFEYWCGIQEFRTPVDVDDLQGVLDAWNTMSYARLIACVTHPNEAEQVRSMKAFSRWYESSMQISSGQKGGFKEDGSMFHHYGHYPAYANGAFASLGEVIYFLSNTSFQLSNDSRHNLKNSLLALRYHSNKNDWGVGVCGRHPLGGNISSGVHEAFYYTAIAGNPDTGEDTDQELAEACLRLTTNPTIISNLSGKGFEAEPSPNGFKEMNFAAMGLFRKNDWLVTLKGFNQHVWNTEIYTGDNLYGRYQSYGTVQITGSDGIAASGYDYNGWDWNRNPGTTTIHLPFDKLLQKDKFATTIFQGEEKFAGASSFDGNNGVFAMVLKELSFQDYTPDHKAHKSAFCFGNKIICLGSAISNSNTNYPTETTVFQHGLNSQSTAIYTSYSGESLNSITQFPYETTLGATNAKMVIDPAGNGFYFPANVPVTIYRQNQTSPNDKTKVYSSGNFASAIINHGNAPTNGSYHYVILPYSTQQELSDFATAMENGTTAKYTILQHDEAAHVLSDTDSKITAYAIFDVSIEFPFGLLKQVNNQCMVMYKPLDSDTTEVEFTICNPDLNLILGVDDIEPSSKPVVYQFSLHGGWNVSNAEGEIVYSSHETGTDNEITSTTFTVTSMKGKTIKATLQQSGAPTFDAPNKYKSEILVTTNKANNTIVIKNIPKTMQRVSISDVAGRNIVSSRIAQQDEIHIPMNQHSSGIYIVSLQGNGNKLTKKVVW